MTPAERLAQGIVAATGRVDASFIKVLPAGTVLQYTGDTAPMGTLKANGGTYLIATYPELYALYGTKYGGNGVSTFGVPEMRGEFLRGADDGRGVDPGRKVGSYQGDAIRNITGDIFAIWGVGPATSGAFSVKQQGSNRPGDGIYPGQYEYNFNASRVVPTANENRPRSIAILYCIVY